ncbi:AAA family ATPase [Nocardia sp. XZ_19_369]|uniref:AAA family ATPase n=1 Tax=Nocardia sp. XZ_19_369 TaxID=2769487 RepID=UPI00188FE9A1|nr:AAA family ATPase [Nocardia sp. XZ_19_369]
MTQISTPADAAAVVARHRTDEDFPREPEPGAPDHGRAPPGRRKPLGERLLSLADLGLLPAAEPLVDGLLYRNTLAQLAGPPGSYKSFVAVGISCALSTGQNWETHHVPSREKVVYVAAEGASGLRARILAWCELTRVDPRDLEGWLYVLPCPVQLGALLEVTEAAQLAAEIGAGLLVLDTRARCTLGLEENSATEQGRAIDAAERIREAAGCTVLAVHHTGRSGTAPRGSTAWDGAVWSDLRLKSDYLAVSIHVEKHKDAPSGMDFDYRLVPHTVSESLMPGVGEDGRKSLVIVPFARGTTQSDEPVSLRKVWDIAGTTCGTGGLTTAQLRDLAMDNDVSRTRAYEAINMLVERGILRDVGTGSRVRYVCTRLPPGDGGQ